MCQVYGLKGYIDDCEYVLSDLTRLPHLVEGESHGILLFIIIIDLY